MMRVAILSDTHGQLDARIAELIERCDIAVHGGDIGSADVLSRLRPRSGRVHAVIGNNDVARKWPEDERALLERLPEQDRVALPGGELVVVHGHQLSAKGRHDRLRRQYPQARAIVYGHSHRLVADCESDPWVLNPGAAGRARTCGGPSCMLLSATAGDWSLSIHRFDLPRDKAKTARRIAIDRPEKRQQESRSGLF